ncbi:hypothetical protein VNO80_04317 [Phaseolus coccineus]|uniref:Uncharacterized protein n=1 Tax=Phaseolus coccineus TaxID=3886 RepID=A0AAN9NT69_PHACN
MDGIAEWTQQRKSNDSFSSLTPLGGVHASPAQDLVALAPNVLSVLQRGWEKFFFLFFLYMIQAVQIARFYVKKEDMAFYCYNNLISFIQC